MRYQHGTHAAYVLDHCRCTDCTTANRSYEKNRIRQKAYGRTRWCYQVDPVRDHITELRQAGYGTRTIAQLAGINRKTIQAITGGISRGHARRKAPAIRILKTTAQKILAIPTPPAPGYAPYQARLQAQALVALGWSMTKIADRIGCGPSNAPAIIAGDRRLNPNTIAKINTLYAELSMTLPPQHTHHQKIAANRARNYAKTRGWLPPLDLEVIGYDWSDEYPDEYDTEPAEAIP